MWEFVSYGGFEIEVFIYLIGPITWFAGIFWFFIPYALGNVGYLIWTMKEHFDWEKRNSP